ncbi:MAG: hypothetical protein H6617_11810 [Bdellovibrionaceae bacterium]|nr:hypothetical protein [Pseudobdellovibrionaceae bacterium]
MRFGVPVIALKRGAVAETLGQSGVQLSGDSEEELVHALRYLQRRPALRERLIEKQNTRVAELKRFQNKKTLCGLLLETLQETRQPKQSKKVIDERTTRSDLQA